MDGDEITSIDQLPQMHQQTSFITTKGHIVNKQTVTIH